MESVEASNRHSSIGLPSINHLDSERVKREEIDYQRKQHVAATAMASPLHPYSGPSHLHSNHQPPPATSAPGSLGGLLSPPGSRRTSGDEKESQRPTARQSLPSIHEALGSEQPLSYPSTVPPPSALVSAPQHYLPPAPTVSPADQRPRHFASDLHASQGPSNPFSHPRSPFLGSGASQVPPPPPSQPQNDPLPRPPFSDPRQPYSTAQHNPKLPTLHPLKTAQSPPTSAARPNIPYPSYPPPAAAHYESAAPQSASSMNHPYPYSQYPSNYSHSASSASAPNSAYPPSAAAYSAPPRYPPPAWRDTNSDMAHLEEKKINRSSLAPYGESVKRHLESFDLEASLNEMADASGNITEFSRAYRQRAHENQRIGMTPQSMPRLEEVDEMLKQGERIQMSLQRMRDVVYNHQATIVEPPHDPRYRSMNGYDHDSASNYGDDGKGNGGFANGDSKTRKRGRAAPPGRCHSCNRAETPEWRRGPDGARTLCNACGLHYAKLTRKMGGKQAMTSSNLRPKSLDQGSPSM